VSERFGQKVALAREFMMQLLALFGRLKQASHA